MTASSRERSAASAARSAAASLGWNYAGSLAALLLQLGYTAYTGRAVAPTSFGAYAIALTVIQLFCLFANAGLATCLLRWGRLTSSALRAARYLGGISGLVCFALVEAVAPICADLWRMPDLAALLQLLGCLCLVQPAVSVTVAALRRVGLTRSAVAAELVGQAAGMAVGAVLLACGWNPLGLAATQLAAAVVTLVVGTVCIVRCPLPPGPPVRARDLLAACGLMTGYSLGLFLINSAPLWVVGRLLGASDAGSYSRASLLSRLPFTFMAQGLNWAATPMLAERRRQELPLDRAVEHVMCMASAVAFIGFGALAGIGPASLGLLLGPGWHTACALVPVLAVASGLALLCSAGGSVDQVRHASRALVDTQLAVVVTTAAGMAVAVVAHSLFLLAGAVAVGQAAGHLAQLVRWQQAGVLRAGVVVRTHVIHAAVGTALGGAATLGGLGRSSGGAFICGLVAMLPVVLACLLVRTRVPLYATAVGAGLLKRGNNTPAATTL